MKTVRWGIIGTGEIVRKAVAPAISALECAVLSGVASRDASRAERFARETSAGRWYRSWQELLDDHEIDAVYVATPHDLHAAQTIAAAKAGKHVLCEKPMALNSSQCREMMQVCLENGVRLGVAYYRRHYPLLHRIKEILENGGIGTVSLCQINSFTWYDLKPGDPQYWLFQKSRSGGGPLMIGGCHRIEMLLNLFGPITKTLGVKENVHARREIEDTAVAVFRHSRGPVSVLCMSHSISEANDTLHLFGSQGTIHVAALNRGELVWTRAGESVVEQHPASGNSHLPLIRDFCEAVLRNREPVANGALGLEVQLVEDAIYGTPRSSWEVQ
jgi:predicted dehydrogenase